MTAQLASNFISTYAPTKKVMIVEDESVVSLDIKHSLMRLGYDIAGIAASGNSAIEKIQSSQPDLILVDIHLKGEMTGIDLSKKVRENFQIPIVYLTANADSSTFKAANQTDPYGYLLKPFEERELGIAVEIALHQHEQAQVIRSSERWYATAFQSLSEAVIATDRHGNVIFMNALAELITDWSLTEAIDRPMADVLTLQRKIRRSETIDGSDSIGMILEATLGASAEGMDAIPLPHQARLLTRSLQIVPVEGRAVAIRDTTGYVTGSLFTFRTVVEGREPTAKPRTNTPPDEQQSSSKRLANSAPDLAKKPISQHEIGCIQTFIESFIREQPTCFASGDLVASYDQETTTLTSRKEGNIVTGKLIRNALTAVVNRSSTYWESVCRILIENSFFPVSQRTNGTCHFQYCTIPEDCQVYRTSALGLWEVWHGKACPSEDQIIESSLVGNKVSRASLMVLRRGSWYHIQSLSLSNDIVKIKTIAGELFISIENLLVWGTQRWH